MITTDFSTFIKRYYKNKQINIPNENSTIYLIRLSKEVSLKEYKIMKNKLILNKITFWDKDHKNKIKINNWLGFIIGNKKNSIIELYQINDEKLFKNKLKDKIYFKNQPILSYNWNKWKEIVGYSVNYMPKGYTRSKNPFPKILM